MNPTERIKDLDELPFPALHLLPPLKKYRSRARKGPSAPIVTSGDANTSALSAARMCSDEG